MYDNAPLHKKRAADALNPSKMRMSQGKACASIPYMRDTEWEDVKGRIGAVGEVHKQSMVVSKPGPKKE